MPWKEELRWRLESISAWFINRRFHRNMAKDCRNNNHLWLTEIYCPEDYEKDDMCIVCEQKRYPTTTEETP